MANAIALPEVGMAASTKSAADNRLTRLILWQVVFSSGAAFYSQLLIFDEANWYRIDFYDTLAWGLIVSQVFALALYVSRFRINTLEGSLRVFYCLGALATGLTLAAMTFLVIDAVRNHEPVLPVIGIAGGYWVAVFVFLVAMFLQLRLAFVCLGATRELLGLKRPDRTVGSDALRHSYAMADMFAFTGLAAVSISAYRLVLVIVTDHDSLRFLAMFYAASCAAFCTYTVYQTRWRGYLKMISFVLIVFMLTQADRWLVVWFPSSLARFDAMLMWNLVVVLSTFVHCKLLGNSALISEQPKS